jgi:hypothetical protein
MFPCAGRGRNAHSCNGGRGLPLRVGRSKGVCPAHARMNRPDRNGVIAYDGSGAYGNFAPFGLSGGFYYGRISARF